MDPDRPEPRRSVERDEESVPPPLRHSRYWAIGAFLLLLTAFWLPWWVVVYEDDGGFQYDGEAAHLFNPEQPATNAWGPYVTGGLAVVVAAWLFIRIAGRSHAYEPALWSRDLAIQAGGLVLALASTVLWPDDVPNFWGGRTFTVEGGLEFTESAMPGLGWWLALLAAVLLGVAWWVARPARTERSDRDRSNDSP